MDVSPPASVIRSLEHRLACSYRRLGSSGRMLLLAVSGGADSTALLLASHAVAGEVGSRLEVAYVDHGLRAEAAQELASVQRLAGHLEVPAHVIRLSIARGPGLEARARLARYDALELLAAQRSAWRIVTAHTASDQAETLLMRLVRGAALRGAAGVLATRGRVLRPMLDWSRAEVLHYLDARAQTFSRDVMNEDPSFLRVRVRHTALPALERAAGHSITQPLARFARLAGEDDALLTELAEAALARLRVAPDALDRLGLIAAPLPLLRRVLARFMFELGVEVSYELIEQGVALVHGGPAVPTPRDGTLRRRGARLVWECNPPRKGTPAL